VCIFLKTITGQKNKKFLRNKSKTISGAEWMLNTHCLTHTARTFRLALCKDKLYTVDRPILKCHDTKDLKA
jgi:hypothetical protein